MESMKSYSAYREQSQVKVYRPRRVPIFLGKLLGKGRPRWAARKSWVGRLWLGIGQQIGQLILRSDTPGSGPVESSHLVPRQKKVENTLAQQPAASNNGRIRCLPIDSHGQLSIGPLRCPWHRPKCTKWQQTEAVIAMPRDTSELPV